MTHSNEPQPFTVRIHTGRVWYEFLVGETFEVVQWLGFYILAEDYRQGVGHWRAILRDDAYMVDENGNRSVFDDVDL